MGHAYQGDAARSGVLAIVRYQTTGYMLSHSGQDQSVTGLRDANGVPQLDMLNLACLARRRKHVFVVILLAAVLLTLVRAKLSLTISVALASRPSTRPSTTSGRLMRRPSVRLYRIRRVTYQLTCHKSSTPATQTSPTLN